MTGNRGASQFSIRVRYAIDGHNSCGCRPSGGAGPRLTGIVSWTVVAGSRRSLMGLRTCAIVAGWSSPARDQVAPDAAGCLHSQSHREDARRQKASRRTTTRPGSGSLTIIPARSPSVFREFPESQAAPSTTRKRSWMGGGLPVRIRICGFRG